MIGTMQSTTVVQIIRMITTRGIRRVTQHCLQISELKAVDSDNWIERWDVRSEEEYLAESDNHDDEMSILSNSDESDDVPPLVDDESVSSESDMSEDSLDFDENSLARKHQEKEALLLAYLIQRNSGHPSLPSYNAKLHTQPLLQETFWSNENEDEMIDSLLPSSRYE